jgi:hypothetical protein
LKRHTMLAKRITKDRKQLTRLLIIELQSSLRFVPYLNRRTVRYR